MPLQSESQALETTTYPHVYCKPKRTTYQSMYDRIGYHVRRAANFDSTWNLTCMWVEH